MTATGDLTQALLDIEERGASTPCQGRRRDRWTSDDREERAWAASVCVSLACPALRECAAAADERREKHYVWAGVDRSPTTTSRRGAA